MLVSERCSEQMPLFSDLDFTRNESFENGVGNIYELLLKKNSPEDCRVLVRTVASGAWHQ